MASTIQVDKIQDTGGNTIISSNSTGTFTSNLPAVAPNVSTATGTLPIANGGTGTTSYSPGITVADQWRITSSFTNSGGASTALTTNWERGDSGGAGYIVGISESSGIFSMPSTGIYLIQATFFSDGSAYSGTNNYVGLRIDTTLNDSSYDRATDTYQGKYQINYQNSAGCSFMFDVTDVSTHKFKIVVESLQDAIYMGNSTRQRTGFNIIRLGDT